MALAIWLFFERPAIGTLIKLALARGVQLLFAAMVASLVIWAGYRFSIGKTPGVSFSVPAPELFSGIADVRKHNAGGHLTYLLGAVNTVGWPYFYAVALAVKTPLAVLALGISGLALLFSRKRFGTRGWIAPSLVLGILIFSSFFSNIRIGTRHVMPVFVAFAIAGGCAAIWIPRIVTPGKSPFRNTARPLSDTSARSGRELLAELNADPRSGLAAFSRPPSSPPCGILSGFPPYCLAAIRWGSAGFRPDIRPPEVRVETAPTKSSEVDIEIFNFPSPIRRIWDNALNPSAQGQANIGLRLAK
jgi:hypothetical protein